MCAAANHDGHEEEVQGEDQIKLAIIKKIMSAGQSLHEDIDPDLLIEMNVNQLSELYKQKKEELNTRVDSLMTDSDMITDLAINVASSAATSVVPLVTRNRLNCNTYQQNLSKNRPYIKSSITEFMQENGAELIQHLTPERKLLALFVLPLFTSLSIGTSVCNGSGTAQLAKPDYPIIENDVIDPLSAEVKVAGAEKKSRA
jgi:hypothetical protein